MVPLSLTGRILQTLVRLCCAHPALTVSMAFAFAALGAGYAAHSLTLETSKFHLLPLHQRYATLYKDYAEDFGQLDDIVVVVEGPRSRPLRPTRPAWRVSSARALSGQRASAIGSMRAASKRTAYCTCRSTPYEKRSTQSPPRKSCWATSPPRRRSIVWSPASTSPSAGRFCPGASAPATGTTRTPLPPACFPISPPPCRSGSTA